MAPTGSVDIVYSNLAQHWLSEGVPCPLPAETGVVWGNQLAGLAEYEDIFVKWSEASRKDWDRFLSLRGDEMRKGGIMIISIQSSRLNGELSEMYADSCQVAKRQCVEEGIFTEEEAEQMCVPEYLKSMFEILDPLKSNSQTWEILEVQHGTLPCVFTDDDVAHEQIKPHDAVQMCRSFMDSSLERAFAEEKEHKLNQFWQKVMQIGVDDISKLSTGAAMTYLALRRK